MQRHTIPKSADRSDPVTPADHPKPGNAFNTGTGPRRCNLDLDTNRIFARTAIASRIARLHARPRSLRGARGHHRRWSSRLRVGASVRRNDDNGQNDKFLERFHGDSPISAWIRPARNEVFIASSALQSGIHPVLTTGADCACKPPISCSPVDSAVSPWPVQPRRSQAFDVAEIQQSSRDAAPRSPALARSRRRAQ
jgi:hypothetical protein